MIPHTRVNFYRPIHILLIIIILMVLIVLVEFVLVVVVDALVKKTECGRKVLFNVFLRHRKKYQSWYSNDHGGYRCYDDIFD